MKVAPDVSQKPRMVKYYSGCSRELLCRCKYFETERIQVTKGFAFSVMDASFQVLMCLDGYGEVQTMDAEQKPMRFSKGEGNSGFAIKNKLDNSYRVNAYLVLQNGI